MPNTAAQPVLLIQTRADDVAVADELRSTAALGEFVPGQLRSLRLDREVAERPGHAGAPCLDWQQIMNAHAAIILGGSPFNSSDPAESKTPVQRRVESELRFLLDLVVAQDYPFLGACYGVGALGVHQGAVVDTQYGEPAGVVRVRVTESGAEDPLLAGVDVEFDAFVGHKEAVSRLPETATLLVGGEACPVQMFRVGAHVYATQFHPELDQEGLLFRLRLYAHHGYYDLTEQQALFTAIEAAEVTQPQRILANFVRRYAQNTGRHTGPGRSRNSGATSAVGHEYDHFDRVPPSV
ncbi:glutamine amidotransferase [Citricoccus muralis]|uniref:Glutamine amidotransferase n=1 Tax=Citricoccus muralis TaxID=169134 RepID=A0ABY8H7Y2_9MICC|nr:glutamine amidotransferase [Citricoccus muralis]WFP17146.1 glutamine amidotransferase [Citricoccus muralis]